MPVFHSAIGIMNRGYTVYPTPFAHCCGSYLVNFTHVLPNNLTVTVAGNETILHNMTSVHRDDAIPTEA